MIWQDFVLFSMQLLLSIALIPQVYHGFKNKECNIAYPTLILTAFPLIVVAIIFFSLGLYMTFIINSTIAMLWFILLIQKIIYS